VLLPLLVATARPTPAAAAEPGSLTVKGSYLLQRVAFNYGYGAFLKERFGAQAVDLSGVALSATRWSDARIGYGLELDALRGGFDYRTLNGDARRAEFALRQVLARVAIAPPGPWEYGLGVGLGSLTRSLEGFHSADINASNLGSNTGVARARTLGLAFLGEVLYRFHGPRFGVEAGLRYSVAPHYIPASDERPALDDAQRPVASVFNVGGLAYVLTLAVLF